MKFDYQSQKLSQARSVLMLPHTLGEAESIAEAFGYISGGFHAMRQSNRENDLDDHAKRWVAKLEEMMDTTGLTDPTGRKGLILIKAETFDTDQQRELSKTVDELANYFHREMWQSPR